MRILLSRTDNIGDVVLTLPMAGLIKEKYPEAKVLFLGKKYTENIITCCKNVDEFIDWSEISKLSDKEQVKFFANKNIDVFVHVFPNKHLAKVARKARIKVRIGTSHRVFHYFNCNRLENFSRKKSDLHEAQLNTKLLKSLGIDVTPNYNDLSKYIGFTNIPNLSDKWTQLLSTTKKNVILHPKSNGSAQEWGLDNFQKLVKLLVDSGKAKVFLTGTEDEGKIFRDKLFYNNDNLVDLSGQMTLMELISFISNVDTLVAASTGPLHIAGVCGIQTIGLYPTTPPIHAGRWSPIGKNINICDINIINNTNKYNRCEHISDIPPKFISNLIEENKE